MGIPRKNKQTNKTTNTTTENLKQSALYISDPVFFSYSFFACFEEINFVLVDSV